MIEPPADLDRLCTDLGIGKMAATTLQNAPALPKQPGAWPRRYSSMTQQAYPPDLGSDEAAIPLRGKNGSARAWARVDLADIPELMQWRWCLSNGYAVRGERTNGRNRLIPMHRHLMGLKPCDGHETDHINRDRLDNRRANLRVVTRGQNAQNLPAHADARSRYRGVYWQGSMGKWAAEAQINYVKHRIGHFDDEDEAGAAVAAFRASHMPMSSEAG